MKPQESKVDQPAERALVTEQKSEEKKEEAPKPAEQKAEEKVTL